MARTKSQRVRVAGWAQHFATISTYIIVPSALAVTWWVVSDDSSSLFFPPLREILERFRELWLFAHLESDILPSLARMFTGYAIAIVLGVAIGILCGRIAAIYSLVGPVLHFGRSIPATALLPVAITVLGVGDGMKIALIAAVCVFPILLNTVAAVSSIDDGLEDVARSFQLNRRQRLAHVLLPAAAPQVFAAARVSLGIALIMMIVTEMTAATSGIGYITLQAQQTFKIADMWAGMLLLGMLGVLLNSAFLALERRVVHWMPRTTEA